METVVWMAISYAAGFIVAWYIFKPANKGARLNFRR